MQRSEAIRTENLSKTFGRGDDTVQAVANLNLQVERGQVYGFLGPNGAGKTTTIRMLMDLIRPTIGTAYIFGIDVRQQREVRGAQILAKAITTTTIVALAYLIPFRPSRGRSIPDAPRRRVGVWPSDRSFGP